MQRVCGLFLLGFLGVAAAGLGLAERADGRVAVDLLVARQARLHGGRLLSVNVITYIHIAYFTR